MAEIFGAKINGPIRKGMTLLTTNEIARLVVIYGGSLIASEDSACLNSHTNNGIGVLGWQCSDPNGDRFIGGNSVSFTVFYVSTSLFLISAMSIQLFQEALQRVLG